MGVSGHSTMAFASAHEKQQRIQLGRYQAHIVTPFSCRVEQHSHADAVGVKE